VPKGTFATTPPAEKAVLVLVHESQSEDEYAEEELGSLADAAGINPVGIIHQRVAHPSTATYIGKGKVEELHAAMLDESAGLAVFDCELTGMQHRNLEEALNKRVLDRTQLILDIFAQRAHTREGKLQVELAQYTYLMPKVMAVYTKFERQKGGIGLRGPGETKLEADRRRIRDRISDLKAELEEVRKARGQQRASRRKHPFPFASIVGYTSAGKSTLMNALAGSELFADPMLFATLDPTTRKVSLPDGYSVFVTDTVGFVRKLPTQLVAAFRATLEEVTESDFLIHVVDASHPNWELQSDAVSETLEELGAGDKPVLTVFNKIDRLSDASMTRELVANTPDAVAISALSHVGMDDSMVAIQRVIRSLLSPIDVVLPYSRSGLVQECYDFGRVLEVQHLPDGIHVRAELVHEMAEKLKEFAV
jgi:GTP-binding protein HflX